jgi:hypothetical protein
MKKLINEINPEINPGVFPDIEFTRCCSERFSSLSVAEREALIESAIRETPAYRARLRNGFELICGKEFNEITSYITFSVCR